MMDFTLWNMLTDVTRPPPTVIEVTRNLMSWLNRVELEKVFDG